MIKHAPKHGLSAVLPLFLVIFIDGMGMGIIFPILNPVYMDPIHGILSANASEAVRTFMYGLTLFMFPLCMFFSTPVLGDMSDSAGRKKILLFCLLGAALGYLVSGVGVAMHSVLLLLLGRVVAGFTAGSQPVAQAAIIDIAPPEKRAQYLSWLMFPASLGFVAGPLLSGYLADSRLVSWFGLTTPLYFAAIISLLNAIYLVFAFFDTKALSAKRKVVLHQALGLFLGAFKNRDIRILSLAFLSMGLGWGTYFQYISLYLTQHFHYSAQTLGLFMGVIGLGFAIGFIAIIKYMVKYFKLSSGISLCWLVSAIGVAVTVMCVASWPAWIMGFFVGIFMAVSYAGTLTLYSQSVGEEHQGWVMGVAMSVVAFGFAVMSIVPSWLSQLASWVPLVTSSVLLLIAAILMAWFYWVHRK